MQLDVVDGTSPLPRDLDDLVSSCTQADAHAPFGEHTMLALHGARQVRHARVEARALGRLTGCGVLSEGLDAWYLELAVAPGARGSGVGSALRDAAVAHVASHGGGLLRGWVHSAGPGATALVRDWTTSRVLHVLDRPLDAPLPPPAVPAGLRLRTLDPLSDADRDAWLVLSNAAFAGHPENGGWTRAELDWRMAAAWTDGARLPVLEDAEGLVAGVWTKVERPGDGELYVVAVAPRAQGRGLGRVVVDEALRLLHAAGCTRAHLYVDADNAPARRPVRARRLRRAPRRPLRRGRRRRPRAGRRVAATAGRPRPDRPAAAPAPPPVPAATAPPAAPWRRRPAATSSSGRAG